MSESTPGTPGTETVVTDVKRAQALNLVVAYFETLGATDVKVRLEGYEPPAVIEGTIAPHRPDLICKQKNFSKTPMIVEVVLDPKEFDVDRITLLNSAAQLYHADLAFVVSADVSGAEPRLRYKLGSLGIIPQQVFVI